MQMKRTRGRERVFVQNDEAGPLCLGVTTIANEKIETRGENGDLARLFQDKVL